MEQQLNRRRRGDVRGKRRGRRRTHLGGKRGGFGGRQIHRGAKRGRVAMVLFFIAAALLFYLHPFRDSAVISNLDAPYQIAYNRTAKSRTKEDVCYIVVHDTANKSRGADAMRHYAFFNRENQASSADFFVDDTQILQVNDYFTYYTWHCGDGKGTRDITNQNSIGVEICVNRDGNYRKALENAEQLVARLMAELDIDASHVVRHYDASGKNCPASMEKHNWRKWEQFKEAIQPPKYEKR